MNYPVWDVAIGAGLLLALVTIVHVLCRTSRWEEDSSSSSRKEELGANTIRSCSAA
jgi:hypothetical protein